MNHSTRLAMPISAMLLFAAAISGCAGLNDSLTPSTQVIVDKFDNSTIVRQEPVNASAGMGDEMHTLGFEWVSRTPEIVYVTAGTHGRKAIMKVAFNADGTVIDKAEPAASHTDYSTYWSQKRFSISWDDFNRIAAASEVQMKVGGLNDYTVSSFGPAHPNATVNSKFAPFLEKVRQLRAPKEKT